MRAWLQHRWTPLYLLSLSLGAYALFLHGFFPLKYNSGNIASWDDLPVFINDVSIDGQEVYNPGGDTSVILMVIDALRVDFVSEELMPFTTGLVGNKSACEYVAFAEPPTVTMPRIKAMMTGTVSTFADVAFNFGAPAVRGDSVVRAAAGRGRRNYLYGDETWLNLFPGLWTVEDGTTSFYVTDYTEVDNNVTRHLSSTLRADQSGNPPFDFLVLHYLGLDHIGHLEGVHGPNLAPKLKEMDDIIKKIFTDMTKWKRKGALIVCGDHGMRDAGGHGGSSYDERAVPIVLIRPDTLCPHEEGPFNIVSQIDLAPSIAYLLRAPIPADSTGRLLPALLPGDRLQRLYLLHYTALGSSRALLSMMGDGARDMEWYKQFRRAEEHFGRFLSTESEGAASAARMHYEGALEEMATLLASTQVDFDQFAIGLGIFALFLITGATFEVTLHSLNPFICRNYRCSKVTATILFCVTFGVLSFVLATLCALTETNSNICCMDPLWTPLAAIFVLALTYVMFVLKSAFDKDFNTALFKDLNFIDGVLIFGSLIHSLTFVGTSFIEEEHDTWYYSWHSLALLVLLRAARALVHYATLRAAHATELQDKPRVARAARVSALLLLCWLATVALHRFLRTMNQTGDRWAFLPDSSDWLNEASNAFYLETLLCIGMALTLLICLWNLQNTNNIFQMNTALTIVGWACIVVYRMATKSLPSLHKSIPEWDTYHIVNVFWGILMTQYIMESLTFLGAYRQFCADVWSHGATKKFDEDTAFIYKKKKEKREDYEDLVGQTTATEEDHEETDAIKLKFARSLSHITLNSVMLTSALLMRPHNVVMVPSLYATCVLTSKCLQHTLLPTVGSNRNPFLDVLSQALAYHWIGEVFYFYQGNSNSLASVDITAGYVGVREYSPVVVGARIALLTYSGPLIASALLYATLAGKPTWTEYRNSLHISIGVQAFLRIYSLAAYTTIAYGFRHHLFVWSVFSPKLLFEFTATATALVALASTAAVVGAAHVMQRLAVKLAVRKL